MKNIAQGNEISDSGSGIHVSDQETDFESESVVSDSSNDADEQEPEREGEWSKNLDNTRVIVLLLLGAVRILAFGCRPLLAAHPFTTLPAQVDCRSTSS